MPSRDFAFARPDERARAYLAGELTDVPPTRSAATVMLVRDGAGSGVGSGVGSGAGSGVGDGSGAGVEVFMLRRVSSMEFAPNVWVFPGGGVDPRDAAPELPWAGPTPAEWAQRLECEEPLARSLVAAAVREVFEECGVLLAGPHADEVVADLRDPEWDVERARLLSREQSLSEMLLRRGLVLRSDLLSAHAHWVTPEFETRRYDTYFFGALLPDGQVPDDDTSEADVADWTVPATLLADVEAGRAMMLPPTVVTLESVAAAPSAAAFVASGGSMDPISPELLEVDGRIVLRAHLP